MKEVSQYIKELVNNRGKIHDTARENLKAKQERQMEIKLFILHSFTQQLIPLRL
jgi:hypothetical protein